jgi:hypothetical protein
MMHYTAVGTDLERLAASRRRPQAGNVSRGIRDRDGGNLAARRDVIPFDDRWEQHLERNLHRVESRAVLDRLEPALQVREPLDCGVDRIALFAQADSGRTLEIAGNLEHPMGSRGDCYDNAVAESFFATLKQELIHGRSWPSKAELRTEVFEYIEVFFNRRRRHSALGFLPPEQFETITNHHHLKERQPRLTTPCPPTRGNSTNPRPLSGARTEASRLPIRRAQRVRRTTALDRST